MLEGDEWKGEDYDRRFEGPEAKLQQAYHREIVKLHKSLPEKSSDLDLFTFAEIKQWGLRHCRKRAKDIEDE